MPRPLKRRQHQENARFLAALARTGNARLAALVLGVNRSTYAKRRAKHPAFAAAWHAALAAAKPHRRRPRTGGITPEIDAALLNLLAEGHSLRLAAASLGFAHASLLARAAQDPAFAHELRVHAAIGSDRLVLAAMDRAAAPVDCDFNADLAIPRMTVEQAMLQLTFHRPDGRFQRLGCPIPRHPTFEQVAPGLRAKVAAMIRLRQFNETGRWRLDSEAPNEPAPASAADAQRRRS